MELSMSDLIKPFYIYKCGISSSSNKHCKHVIAYNETEVEGELHIIVSSLPLISKQIRDVHKCSYTDKSSYSYGFYYIAKLGFEDLIDINKHESLKMHYFSSITGLLELMLINWDEWN